MNENRMENKKKTSAFEARRPKTRGKNTHNYRKKKSVTVTDSMLNAQCTMGIAFQITISTFIVWNALWCTFQHQIVIARAESKVFIWNAITCHPLILSYNFYNMKKNNIFIPLWILWIVQHVQHQTVKINWRYSCRFFSLILVFVCCSIFIEWSPVVHEIFQMSKAASVFGF